jgi:DNA-directed RNA polymerase specialized sigma24 family protein
MPPADDDDLLSLAAEAAAGDEDAWQRIWRRVDGPLAAMIRQFHMGRISHEEDERRAVILEVMARLRVDGFRRLRQFVEASARDPKLALLPWLKVVARRVAIDQMRAHPSYVVGRRDEAGGRGTGAWKDPKSLPPPSLLPGERPAMTRDGTARQMLAYAREALPEPQYRALALKVQGEEPSAIAAALDLADAAAAERLVRAAMERLRRRFRTGGAT